MSKGGHTTSSTTSTKNPWDSATPALLDALQSLNTTRQTSLTAQQAALQGGIDYSKSTYGADGTYGSIMGNLGKIATGQGGGAFGDQTPAAQAALARMLSAQPDYSGVQASIKAANDPILRQLNTDIIPGLNTKATFLNNSTGGIKALNRVLPDVTDRMATNASTLTEAERIRALNAQQAGLTQYGNLTQQANSQAMQAGNAWGDLSKLGLTTSQLEQAKAALPYQMDSDALKNLIAAAQAGGTTSTTTDQNNSQNSGSQAVGNILALSQMFPGATKSTIDYLSKLLGGGATAADYAGLTSAGDIGSQAAASGLASNSAALGATPAFDSSVFGGAGAGGAGTAAADGAIGYGGDAATAYGLDAGVAPYSGTAATLEGGSGLGGAGGAAGAAGAGLGAYAGLTSVADIGAAAAASGLAANGAALGAIPAFGASTFGGAAAGAGAAGAAGAAGTGAGTAAAGGAAAGSGMSALAATGWGAVAAAVAAIAANNTQAHVNHAGELLPGQEYANRSDGRGMVAQGNLALGAGNDRSTGTGQFFLKNPQTGEWTWTGKNGSTLMGKLFAKDFQDWTPEQANAYAQFLAVADPGTPLPQGMEYAQPAYQEQSAQNIPERIKTYFGQLGGEQGTGMTYADFLKSAAQLGITITGNVWG